MRVQRYYFLFIISNIRSRNTKSLIFFHITSRIIGLAHQKFTPKLSIRQPLRDLSNSSWQMFARPMSYDRSA